MLMIFDKTLDEKPSHPDLDDALEAATTRIPLPPEQAEAPAPEVPAADVNWAAEVPSSLEMIAQPDTAPAPPTDEKASTDLDLDRQAEFLRQANAETKPFIEKSLAEQAVASRSVEEQPVEDPSETIAGPLAPARQPLAETAAQIQLPAEVSPDESPTWSPENQPLAARAVEKKPIPRARSQTKLDDAAIVEEAIGSHQRYLITAGFALLGLLAGIVAALMS
jgi:hypothetical protein